MLPLDGSNEVVEQGVGAGQPSATDLDPRAAAQFGAVDGIAADAGFAPPEEGPLVRDHLGSISNVCSFGPVGTLPSVGTGERIGPFAPFRYREFTVFWGAGLLSNSGSWMQTVTVPYVVDQLTHSTALVGVSAFASFFPSTLVGPWAGSLSDRYARRTVMIWSQGVMMAMAAVLWITWSTGTASVPLILVCVIVSAVGAGITTAAWQSLVPQLVPRPLLLTAVRLNSMQFTGARAFGPALAGLVLASLGPSAAFLANAASFLLVIGALLLIAPRPAAGLEAGGRVLDHFTEGFRYVRERSALAIAVLMVLLIALLGVSVVQLIEPIARHVFHVGAGRYGLLAAAYGAGAVVGGVFTVVFGNAIRRSRLAVAGLAMMAAGDVLLGVAPVYALALVALVAMGLAQVLCMVACNTTIQLNVDERFRGRASAMFTMSFYAAAPTGALLGGIVGDFVGLRAAVVAIGCLLVAALAVAMVRYGGLRSLDQTPPISDESYPPREERIASGPRVVEAAD